MSAAARATLPPRFAAAAGLAGAVAAIALPGQSLGLGVLLVALALAFAARLSGAVSPDRWSVVFAALTLGLSALAVLRDAEWVVVPSLVAAAALGSLAVAGGGGWLGVGRGLVAATAWMPAGPAAVGRAALPALPVGRRALPVLRGVAIGAGLVAVFGVLFASGDGAFAELARRVVPDPADLGDLPLRAVWFAIAVAFAGGLALAASRQVVAPGAPEAARRRLAPAEWGIALVLLDGLFAAFVAVQAAVLVGHDDHVLRTAGLTYAEYARAGFAQLLVAAMLTLAVVAAAARWARAESARQQLALRALLGVLCLLTLVVLASALHRLGLYVDAFGASRLRLAAQAVAVTVGALVVLTIASLVIRRSGWLPRACVLVAGVALLAFGLSDPDRRIADRNIDRYATIGRIDLGYLRGLSADAVPALADLPPRLRPRVLGTQRARLAGGDGWQELNFGRSRARRALGLR